MSSRLLALPGELLTAILEHVGAGWFREDPRRLALSRRWHAVAWPIRLQEVHVDAHSWPTFPPPSAEGRVILQRELRRFHLLVALTTPHRREDDSVRASFDRFLTLPGAVHPLEQVVGRCRTVTHVIC